MARLVGLIALLFLALPAAAQERKEVDLALVLAIDISGSIDPDEARLQRQGYVEAFNDPVSSGPSWAANTAASPLPTSNGPTRGSRSC